jgi:hypothetical protein
MKKMTGTPASPFEDFEIRPLFQLGRAAMSSKDYSPVELTHEGMILLLDIIEERCLPSLPKPRRRRTRKT